MKKTALIVLALMLVFSFSIAEEKPAGVNVFVSVTDGENTLALAYEPILATDQDGDGVITIADALACAHILKHEKGAEAFGYAQTEYGYSLTRLWDVDNGGSYGYMVNDISPMSLQDRVYEEDHIKAYCYTDLVAWSDSYSFFTFPYAEIPANMIMPVTLFSAGYDSAWNPVTFTVSDAVIYVNGEETEIRTNENGLFEISFSEAGRYVITAVSESTNLVAPVCILNITQE